MPRANYGVSVVKSLETIDRVMLAPDCISKRVLGQYTGS